VTQLEFWAPGTPRTKGSVVSMPNGFVDHGDAVRERERVIADAAEIAIKVRGWVTVRSPLAVEVTHYAFVPAPPGADVDQAPVQPGDRDLDKLARLLGDAGTRAGIWGDDVQVVRIIAEKHYADTARGIMPGEYIVVRTLASGHSLRRMRAESISAMARETAAGVGARMPVPRGW